MSSDVIDMRPNVDRPEVPGGPQMHFLGGYFSVGSTRIPYATVHMTVGDVARFLKTPSDLPGWDESDAELEALYQRQLDYRRVRSKILPYLTEASPRPRFFNAITVALVPYIQRQIQPFEVGTYAPPPLERTNTTSQLRVGPITLGLYTAFDTQRPNTFAIGEIRWNYDQVAAVAIDGQHRLAALRMLHEKDPSKEHDTRVCVILMIPAELLGFCAPQNGSLLKLLRSVFIDLNKHAKPVKRARLILLDDVDPQSIVVRRVLGERLQEVDATAPLADGRIPLSLVDWHSDDAKFDVGPYVTSVLMLDKAVELLLGTRTNIGSTSALQKQVKAFGRFGYEPTAACKERLDAFGDAEEDWQDPFAYPQEDLELIRERVGGDLAAVIGRSLTELEPYRRIIEARSDAKALLPSFSTWFEAFTAEQDKTPESHQHLIAVVDRVQADPKKPKIDAWAELVRERCPQVKGGSLFFKVVFQAAYFATLRELWDEPFCAVREDAPETSPKTVPHLKKWTTSAIAVMNGMLVQQDLFFDLKYTFKDDEDKPVQFWAGSALSADKQTVDFSASAQDRIRAWMTAIILLGDAVRALKLAKKPVPSDIDGFLVKFANVDEDYSKKITRTLEWVKLGNAGNPGSMQRVVGAMTDSLDEAYRKGLAAKQLAKRLNQLWGILRKLDN